MVYSLASLLKLANAQTSLADTLDALAGKLK